MIRTTLTLGGLQYAEFLLGGENRDIFFEDDSVVNTFSGARDHLWMVYDYGSKARFMIDDPGTYDGTYGAYLGLVYYHTIVTDTGVIYGVNADGRTAITGEDLSMLVCYEEYAQSIACSSEVIICGIKNI